MTDTVLPVTETASVLVNGQNRSMTGVAAYTTMLNWLREEGVTGPKEGCAEGECGACSVMISRPDGQDGTRWVAVNSCLIPAVALEGQEVYTAEGLASSDTLHPVQQEMAMRGGSQCGYCTPGFISSMAAEYYREGRTASGCCSAPSTSSIVSSACVESSGNQLPWQIVIDDDAPPMDDWTPERNAPCGKAGGSGGKDVVEPASRCAEDRHDPEVGPNGFDLHALSGNLCRCTGYRPIRDAAFALGEVSPNDPIAQRRSHPAPVSLPLRIGTEASRFVRPAHLEETFELLAENPEAVLLAGSTDWGVELTVRNRRPSLTVAIDQLAELRGFHSTDDYIEIGAALTLSEVERLLDGSVPMLDQVFPQFASQLIRNAATIGGNLGTGSPIGDSAPALLALDSDIVLTSVRGERVVPLAEYFLGYRETVRAGDEVIKSVRVPTPVAPLGRFYKVAKRRSDDISSLAVAIAATVTDGTIERIRIGVGGVAATTIRALRTETVLTGKPWSSETFGSAAEVIASEGTPMSDHRASAAYRSATLVQAIRRFYAEVAP